MRSIGKGARKPATSSGGTTTSPRGFSRSLAIFAANMHGATPAEQPSPISERIAAWICRAIEAPSPNSERLAVTSRNASSSESPSMSGVKRPNTRNTSWLTPA